MIENNTPSFSDGINGKFYGVYLNYIVVDTYQKFDKLNHIEVYGKIDLKRKFPNTKTYFTKHILQIKNKGEIKYIKQKLKEINKDYNTFIRLINKVGCADLVLIGGIKEGVIFIEIKSQGDGLRPSQVKWMREAQKKGFFTSVICYKYKYDKEKFKLMGVDFNQINYNKQNEVSK